MKDDIKALAELFQAVRDVAEWFMQHQRSSVVYSEDIDGGKNITYRPLVVLNPHKDIRVGGRGAQTTPLYFVNTVLTLSMHNTGMDQYMKDSRGALYPSKGLTNAYLKFIPDNGKNAGKTIRERRDAMVADLRAWLNMRGPARNNRLRYVMTSWYPRLCLDNNMGVIRRTVNGDSTYTFYMRAGSPVLKCMVNQVAEIMTSKWKEPFVADASEIENVLLDMGASPDDLNPYLEQLTGKTNSPAVIEEPKPTKKEEVKPTRNSYRGRPARPKKVDDDEMDLDAFYTAVADIEPDSALSPVSVKHETLTLGPVYKKFMEQLDEKAMYMNTLELHSLIRALGVELEREFGTRHKAELAAIQEAMTARDKLAEQVKQMQDRLYEANNEIVRMCKEYDNMCADVGIPSPKWHVLANINQPGL